MSFKWPAKGPDEILDYSVDWSRLIENPVTLTAANWFIDYEGEPKLAFTPSSTVYGLTNNSNLLSGKVSTIFLSGGVLNRTYKLYCQVSDSLGRLTERSVTITIRNR